MNVKIIRVSHITRKPNTNAKATLKKMLMITCRALFVLISSANGKPLSIIFDIASALLPPNKPNTIETVVEVGMPNVLKMSSRITSVAATPRKMQSTSSRV